MIVHTYIYTYKRNSNGKETASRQKPVQSAVPIIRFKLNNKTNKIIQKAYLLETKSWLVDLTVKYVRVIQ